VAIDMGQSGPEKSICATPPRFGYPLMLKSRKLAYDGRGNAVAKSKSDVPEAFAKLGVCGSP
jgi:phosphoribosylaminoimidazole carboxylase